MKHKDLRAIKVIEIVEKDESLWGINDSPLTPNMWTEEMKAEGKKNFDRLVKNSVKKMQAKQVKQVHKLLLKGYSIEEIQKMVWG